MENGQLFVLDSTPSSLALETENKANLSVAADFDQSLGYEEDVALEPGKDTSASTFGKCFNCDGEHTLTDCTAPKNHGKIREARKRMRDSAGGSNVRYHEDSDTKSKFKPGRLSVKLQKALGLEDDQLPMHIYQMRFLGYPPGWIEEAKIEEEIKMFDDNHSESSGEFEYDTKKIIEYPGFNVRPPPEIFDECKVLGYPAFDIRRNGIDAMIKHLKERSKDERRKDQDERKRKKLKTSTLDDSDCVVLENVEEAEEVEMLDDFEETDTLAVLEEKKRQLLSALKDEDVTILDEWCDSEAVKDLKPPSSQSTDSGFASGGSLKLGENGEQPNNENSKVYVGTPILAYSPFTKIPDLSSFSDGIEEHIPFENLPGHEGTFNKLRGVLDKIKEMKAKRSSKKV